MVELGFVNDQFHLAIVSFRYLWHLKVLTSQVSCLECIINDRNQIKVSVKVTLLMREEKR